MEYPEALAAFGTAVAGTGPIDLAAGALLVAAAEFPDLVVAEELEKLEALAAGARGLLGGETDPLFCTNTLSGYLFDEIGLRGNRDDYYDPDNSYLNRVLERRLGIPITLAVAYIEVGRRLGVPLQGIGMPGHFLVRHQAVADLFIDPFHGGILLSPAECHQRLQEVTGYAGPWQADFLAPAGERDVLARMLRNLKGVWLQRRDHQRALHALDYLVTLLPDAGIERRDRGLVHFHLDHREAALADLLAYVDRDPDGRRDAIVAEVIADLRGPGAPGGAGAGGGG